VRLAASVCHESCGSLPSTELCSSSLLVMGYPGTTYPSPVDKVDRSEGVILPKIQFWEALTVLVGYEPPMTEGTSGDSFETTQRPWMVDKIRPDMLDERAGPFRRSASSSSPTDGSRWRPGDPGPP
jgi:hypothetical protein